MSNYENSTDLITMHNEKKALLEAIENGEEFNLSIELKNFLKHTDPKLYDQIITN